MKRHYTHVSQSREPEWARTKAHEVEKREHAQFEDVRSQEGGRDVGCGDAGGDYVVLHVTTFCPGLLA